jgi:hypothetical protein
MSAVDSCEFLCHGIILTVACVRWNSGRSLVPLSTDDTLFEGFDCEDSVQSFLQIIQTIVVHKEAVMR